MQINKSFLACFSKLYRLRKSFFQGVLHLLGSAENPYDREVEKIFKRTNHEALRGDFEKVNNDFINAFKRYKSQLPS